VACVSKLEEKLAEANEQIKNLRDWISANEVNEVNALVKQLRDQLANANADLEVKRQTILQLIDGDQKVKKELAGVKEKLAENERVVPQSVHEIYEVWEWPNALRTMEEEHDNLKVIKAVLDDTKAALNEEVLKVIELSGENGKLKAERDALKAQTDKEWLVTANERITSLTMERDALKIKMTQVGRAVRSLVREIER